MATPAFRHMGGKARLRKWLVSHFPDSGCLYLEPFVGKGNVFFWARQQLKFKTWSLSDINTDFLNALTTTAIERLPDTVTKEDFQYWKASTDLVADLLEPRITFAGKGYAAGFSGSSGTHVGYKGSNYRKVCMIARDLLKDVAINTRHWEDALVGLCGNDFVYLDPPYYDTKASYRNIDHSKLIKVLNESRFYWALSGYRNHLYDTRLEFKCRFEHERNSEIKSSNSGKRESVMETLWTNYEL